MRARTVAKAPVSRHVTTCQYTLQAEKLRWDVSLRRLTVVLIILMMLYVSFPWWSLDLPVHESNLPFLLPLPPGVLACVGLESRCDPMLELFRAPLGWLVLGGPRHDGISGERGSSQPLPARRAGIQFALTAAGPRRTQFKWRGGTVTEQFVDLIAVLQLSIGGAGLLARL